MQLVRRFILLALLGPFFAAAAHAVTLDWDTATWTAGSLSNSYDVDPANAGNDVTVTVSGSTTQLQPGLVSPNPQTPAITTALEGGLSPVQKSLEIAVDLANKAQAIVVTVNFSAGYTLGVQNVSFTIFDVDFANGGGSTFQDELRSIQAVGADGVTVIAPTITVGSDVSLTGTGLSQVAPASQPIPILAPPRATEMSRSASAPTRLNHLHSPTEAAMAQSRTRPTNTSLSTTSRSRPCRRSIRPGAQLPPVWSRRV